MKQTRLVNAQERWAPLERRLAERLRHKPLGQCLVFEEFMALVQQGRRAKGYHQHMQHLVSCPACRRAYTELRALLSLQRFSLVRWLKHLRASQFPQWVLASGVAASVFALALWTFYPKSTNPNLIAAKPDAPPRTEVAHNPMPPRDDTTAPKEPSLPKNTVSPKPSRPTGGAQTSGSHEPRNRNTGKTDSETKQPKPSGAPSHSGLGNTQLAKNKTESSAPSPENQGANSSGANQQLAKAGNDNNTRPAPSGTTAPPRENLSPIERDLAFLGNLPKMGADTIRNVLGTLTTHARSTPKTLNFGQLKLRSPRLSESKPVDDPPQFLMEDRTPVFAWEPVDGATKYRVTLRIPRTGEQVDVQELAPEQTEYRVAQSLDPSKTYELTIEAVRERARTLRGTLRFTVMSEAEHSDLKLARQKMKEAPLASGAIFYELQRYKEALEAFEHAQRRDPENEGIRHAIERLRALVNR